MAITQSKALDDYLYADSTSGPVQQTGTVYHDFMTDESAALPFDWLILTVIVILVDSIVAFTLGWEIAAIVAVFMVIKVIGLRQQQRRDR